MDNREATTIIADQKCIVGVINSEKNKLLVSVEELFKVLELGSVEVAPYGRFARYGSKNKHSRKLPVVALVNLALMQKQGNINSSEFSPIQNECISTNLELISLSWQKCERKYISFYGN